MKTLVIGDCHFQSAYPSINYLDKQIETIKRILKDQFLNNDVDHVIYLGDLFHFRKPDPETITKVKKDLIDRCSGEIYPFLRVLTTILRGNHDTDSKSDHRLVTILSVLDSEDCDVVTDTKRYKMSNCTFDLIAHFESDEEVLERIQALPKPETKHHFIFGHFGYKGCLNTNGDEDFRLGVDVFPTRTFLGHIHKSVDEGNVSVLGTPYSTAFSEADNQHRFAVIDRETGEVTYHPINFGIRYLSFEYASLEANKEFISNPEYTTILRVYLNQLTDKSSIDLRKHILDTYKVAYVDIKYLPLVSNDPLVTDYQPKSLVFDLSDEMIEDFVLSTDTPIDKKKILEGLALFKEMEKYDK